MKALRPFLPLALVLASALAAGCEGGGGFTAPDRYDRGLVVCLSGAGGMMGECERIRDGLASGAVDRAIEIYQWSGGDVMADQTNIERNRHEAAQLARRVEAYMSEHRGQPVHLVGISAGTGIAVWTIEALSPEFKIEGVVLLASSLDTKYNLAKALARVNDRIYSFNSVADTVLSLGVTWAGTVDRGGGLAGGLVGFSPPDGLSDDDKKLYREKLVQISWWPGDMVLGHMGDHLGAANPNFVRVRIAPLIMEKNVGDARVLPPVAKKTDDAGATKVASRERPSRGRIAESKRTAKTERAPVAASPASPAVESPVPPRDNYSTDPADSKRRFFGWNVGQAAPKKTEVAARKPAAATPPAASKADDETINEAQFFPVPECLP
jgi:pimeloyl-ACP methyl ester carboxylesterase